MTKAYALLSTYPPTQCGLATFSAALFANLGGPGDHVGVVRVLDEPVPGEPLPGRAPEVVHDLVNGSAQSAAAAVEVMNGFDVAIVQHEYGIYGGPDGQDVVPLLYALRVPSIVVLHTVLARPTTRQRAILAYLLLHANRAVSTDQLVGALWGGIGFNFPQTQQNYTTYANSVEKFAKIAKERGADVPMANHSSFDDAFKNEARHPGVGPRQRRDGAREDQRRLTVGLGVSEPKSRTELFLQSPRLISLAPEFGIPPRAGRRS